MIYLELANKALERKGAKIIPNSASYLSIKTEISRLCSISDHQQGIRCNTPQACPRGGGGSSDRLPASGGKAIRRRRTSAAEPVPAKAGMMP
jgi:hypothetical protein